MADDNKAPRLSDQEHASIPMTIIVLSGLLLTIVGMMYYTFIGPHPDASGSIQENPLNSLLWSDHPRLSSIMIGLTLGTVGYILDRRSRTGGSSSSLRRKPGDDFRV
jgi:hypothetical protein